MGNKIAPGVDAGVMLRKGIAELAIPYTEKHISAFLIYLAELKKWNRVYNLTGLTTDREIVIRHFLDSLLFLKVLPERVRTVADIGSGAGFPGIPMKILRPDIGMFLVEPVKKKAVFLRHICALLRLSDIETLDRRIEDITDLKVDAAVTRALFSVGGFIEKAGPVLGGHGVLILSKGPKVKEELKVENEGQISVTDLKLPYENIIRHLVVVKPGTVDFSPRHV